MDPLRILVVEDEALVAEGLSGSLAALGYRVVGTASDGTSAVKAARRCQPELILIDVVLPGPLDGVEAARRIRAELDVPVVFVTAYADDAILERALATQAHGYLLKPVSERSLRVVIEMARHRFRLEQDLKASQQRYALAAAGSNDGLWDWDIRAGRTYYSPRWYHMLGYSEGDLSLDSPLPCRSLVHPEDTPHLDAALEAHLSGTTPCLECEHRLKRKDGTWAWVACRGMAQRDAEGKAYRMAGSTTDVSARKRMEEELRHGAFHDSLTGLANRALFMDRLSHAMALVSRRPAALFAVLYLDLDRFKVINDSLGHDVGDKHLKLVARRIQDTLRRPADSVSRVSGDEFAILLEELHDASDPTRVAGRVLEAVAQPVVVGRHHLHAGASIGIAMSTSNYSRAEDILRDAETAMYRAKAQGGSQAVVFDQAMHAHALERLTLESDLRQAVERQEFVVHYQPVVSLADGSVTGFEALVRWQHPMRGLVPPAAFIPVAEETGLIVPLGRQVLREACLQVVRWRDSNPGSTPPYISVNLSARQFAREDLADVVRGLLDETGVPPACLKLEITESLLIEESDGVHNQLKGLKALGVQLLLDDFGTGYSSLAYLQRFPIDIVKIDRAFVSGMGEKERAQLIEIIVLLGRTLGMGVVAEGVETATQLQRLRELGCDHAQGYFFSRPVKAEEATALLHGAGWKRWGGPH
jgi:diguanylate cyclase (GGDEF)-like protein/PAS domain S-box-containing protein